MSYPFVLNKIPRYQSANSLLRCKENTPVYISVFFARYPEVLCIPITQVGLVDQNKFLLGTECAMGLFNNTVKEYLGSFAGVELNCCLLNMHIVHCSFHLTVSRAVSKSSVRT